MAVIFVLGPSEWAKPSAATIHTPLEVRQHLVQVARQCGNTAFIMEEHPTRPNEDLVDKFYRLVNEEKTTDIVIYWPAAAKMQTTFDEMILLRARCENNHLPRIHVLYERAAAKDRSGTLQAMESPRSRYLSALAPLSLQAIPWSDVAELMDAMSWLMQQTT